MASALCESHEAVASRPWDQGPSPRSRHLTAKRNKVESIGPAFLCFLAVRCAATVAAPLA